MLSPQSKSTISRIIPFGIIWLIFSIVYSLLEKGILGPLDYYPSTNNPYDFKENIILIAVSTTITGLLIGTIEILYLNRLFLKKSLGFKIIIKTLFYVTIMISFLVVNAIIGNAVKLQVGLFDEQVWQNVWIFFTSFAFWSVEIYLAMIIGVSLFYTEVSDNLGQGVLHNFFTGKYHTPTEEERIFMFLDMKSSTTIAEKLGHVTYFKMLQMYYEDLSNPIIQYAGEIYQYVGDEVIVSWRLNDGLNNNNCLNCFFSMKAMLKNEENKYVEKFGLLPTFKAGFHFGKVITGEIGVVKKDITFSGDVLNTAARIQGLCNTYEVDILISGELLNKLDLNSQFSAKALGESELRGRDEKVELYSIIQGSGQRRVESRE